MTTDYQNTVFDVKTYKQDPRYWERVANAYEIKGDDDELPTDDIKPFTKMVLWWLWIGSVATILGKFKLLFMVVIL